MEHSDPLERAIANRLPRAQWTDDDFRAARERDLAERTVPVGQVVRATLVCLALALMLTTGKLVELAERMEFGATRDRALDLAEGLDRAANFVSLNRPYDAIRDLRDANNGVGADDGGGELVAVASTTTSTTTTPAGSASSSTTTTTTTTTTTVPPGRVVDAATPLRVYVAGDSQTTYLGQAITTESGLPLEVEVDDRISTSLARPDYFNWPERWAEVVTQDDPEVVVLFLGANDHQDMVDAAGERLVEGSDPWQAEWRARLDAALDVLTADGRVVYWITQPPMRDGGLDEGIDVINALAAEVIDERGDVVAVDIWPLFGGSSGYQERLTGPDGDTITARVGDGVHLTRSAASWVADLVFAELEARWTFS